jgi:hypothetical protein
MPRKITEAEMMSRRRVASLVCCFTKVISDAVREAVDDELTYVEVLDALNRVSSRMIDHMQADEWEEAE